MQLHFSVRALLISTVVVAIWLAVHLGGFGWFVIAFETLMLLGFLAALTSTIVFGSQMQRAYAVGAIIAPAAFLVFLIIHPPFPAVWAVAEGDDEFGPIFVEMYYRCWWMLIWLPVSVMLGSVSLFTPRFLEYSGQKDVLTNSDIAEQRIDREDH